MENLIQAYASSSSDDEEASPPFKRRKFEQIINKDDRRIVTTIKVGAKMLSDMPSSSPPLPFNVQDIATTQNDNGSSWPSYIYLKGAFATLIGFHLSAIVMPTQHQKKILYDLIHDQYWVDKFKLHHFDDLTEDPVLGFHISCCRTFFLQFCNTKSLLSKIYNFLHSQKKNLDSKSVLFSDLSMYCNDNRTVFYLALDNKEGNESLPHYFLENVDKWLQDLQLKFVSDVPFEKFRPHLSFAQTVKKPNGIMPKDCTWVQLSELSNLGGIGKDIVNWRMQVEGLYCKIGSNKLYKFEMEQLPYRD